METAKSRAGLPGPVMVLFTQSSGSRKSQPRSLPARAGLSSSTPLDLNPSLGRQRQVDLAELELAWTTE